MGEGCLLGAELSQTAKTEDLQVAYGVFAQEARELNPDYQPETVNTDGSPDLGVIIKTYHEKQAKKRFRILSKFINP